LMAALGCGQGIVAGPIVLCGGFGILYRSLLA
jgi:hypothetical protein